jgi:peptidylprolyl isomerase
VNTILSPRCLTCAALALATFAACKPAAPKEEAPAPEPAAAPTAEPAPAPNPAEGADVPAPPDVAAAPADAQATASGLKSKVLSPGTGTDRPKSHDKVKMHYTGWTSDGKMFDSTQKRGKPDVLDVKGLVPGWSEGVQLMVAGEKRRLWIPEGLGYAGRPGSPAGSLVFDVELVEIIPGQAPIPAPEDVAAPPADAKKTASGLATKVLAPGTGTERPRKFDRVTVNYSGWQTNGVLFDSSVMRGQPASFDVDKVIEGWTEGLQLMVEGEKRRLWIPENLAYKGRPGPPAGMLVFDVELLKVEKRPEPPAVPKDVAAAPKNAKRTPSGLASVVLKKGSGKAHPTASDFVEVHYSGWTTDGKMFDSSIMRGQPARFPLGQVIPGWTEGVQLMVEGEKRRLWIPEDLAYKGRPGAPQGMLVFDVELLKILGAQP